MKKILALILILLQIITTTYAGNYENTWGNMYNQIVKLDYSPDGKSLIFVAKKNGKEVLVKDGKESKLYDSIKFYKFSPDGKSFVFVAKKDWENILVKDWKEISKYYEIKNFK